MASDGVVTLREAIEAASTNAAVGDALAGDPTEVDQITFDPTIFPSGTNTTITLQNGQLEITDDLVITGLGANRVTIDAGGNSRVFYVDGVEVAFSGMTITGGNATNGGGIYLTSSACDISDMTLTNNHSGRGGGLYSVGDQAVTISDSTFSQNTATVHGGGAYVAQSTVLITNTVFSNNSADSVGGGIVAVTDATLDITNSTITANDAATGGGLYNNGGTVTITCANSIVALNTATTGPDIYGTLATTSSNNLIGNGSDQTLVDGVNSNQVGVDPGFINTSGGDYHLSPASLAINAGDNTAASGLDYDLDGNDRRIYTTVDIGAYEYDGNIIVSTLTDESDDGDYSDDDLSLREALYLANQNAFAETILFDPSMFVDGNNDPLPGTITLGGTQLDVDSNVTISGPGADLLTIDADEQSRVFYVDGVEVAFSGMTITGGNATNGGGIYLTSSACDISDMTLTNNHSGRGGGLYSVGDQAVTISDSTFSQNTATVHGGGAYVAQSTVLITNTVFSNNSADSVGGGIVAVTDATLDITNSTITANDAATGGGLYNNGGTVTITCANSIVALNTATTDPNIYGTLTATSTNNLIGTDPLFVRNPSDGGDGWGDDPATGIDESLNNDYGDLRLTFLSPAINFGDDTAASGLTNDLGGRARTVNGKVDIGAYEYQGIIYEVDSTANAVSTTDGVLTLNEALGATNNNNAYGDAPAGSDVEGEPDIITFDTNVFDSASDIIYGQFSITDGLAVIGPGAGNLTIDGNNQSSVLNIGSASEATLLGMAITGGSTTDSVGIYADSDCDIKLGNVVITGSEGLIKTGDGTLALSGTLSLSGGLMVNAGKAVLFTSAPFTNWTENGEGKVLGPGALDFHDTDAGEIYPTLVSCFADDRMIDRYDMLAIFELVAAPDDPNDPNDEGTVTTDEFHDLNLIVDNPYRLQMYGYVDTSDTGYVDALAGYVVDGINNANDYYQGSALGDLAANNPGTKLTKLVNKWFKGLDRPITTYDYEKATGSLFVNGTSIDDMHQGVVGDCYLISTLGSIAYAGIDGDDPGESSNGIADAIEDMIVYNGDYTWTVRFYDDGYNSFEANYVTVDGYLPVDNNDLLVYANYGQELSSELWMPLLEKAYAQWNETGNALRPTTPTDLNGLNSYAGIDGGHTFVAQGQVLGESVSGYYMSTGYTLLNNAINAGNAVTAITQEFDPGNQKDGLYETHAYVITEYTYGYDEGSQTYSYLYTLRNPWGFDDPEEPLTWAELYADCVYYAFADSSGTTPFPSPDGVGVSSGSVPSDTMAALYAALSASQAAGKSDHDGLALKTTEGSLADLDTFQYDRVDAALAADMSGQGSDKSLYDSEETWLTSSDRLDRNPASQAVDMLFSGVKASPLNGLLPDWDSDLPGLG